MENQIQPPVKVSWFHRYFGKKTEEDLQKQAIFKLEAEKERELIRAEEKDKLYRDFDIDALFVEPEEKGFLDVYMPYISAGLTIIVLLIVALKK